MSAEILDSFLRTARNRRTGIDECFFVAKGVDSIVYITPDGRYVLKFYNQNTDRYGRLKPNTLFLYRDITNTIACDSAREDWKLRLNASVAYTLRVNPFIDLARSKIFNCYVGICPFVGGCQLSFESPTGVPTEITDALFNLNETIQARYQISGSTIITPNVKVVSNTLYVTDLAPNIRNIKIV